VTVVLAGVNVVDAQQLSYWGGGFAVIVAGMHDLWLLEQGGSRLRLGLRLRLLEQSLDMPV
jgi:hypothetical protein